jgi:hypothetical protein
MKGLNTIQWGEEVDLYRVLLGKSEEIKHLEDLRVDGKMILK